MNTKGMVHLPCIRHERDTEYEKSEKNKYKATSQIGSNISVKIKKVKLSL
jgi:hypothetical protein